MLADLKEKAGGVDRKRVYTAAAALLIAGAAGHFMQKTSGGSGTPALMSASVPAVSSPEILVAPPDGASEDVAAAAPVADSAPPQTLAQTAPDTAPAETAPTGAMTLETVTAEVTPDAAEADAPSLATLRPAPKPALVPATGTASTAIYPAPKTNPILEEVTRAATDPLLTLTEPAPERPKEALFASASDQIDMPPPAAAAPAAPEIAGCALDVQGVALPGALLRISVTAPCNSGEAVEFDHAGLRFGEQLGPDGSLTIDVPAMMGTARVDVTFADGTDRAIDVTVPDFDAFHRIAVIWQGATGLQLHALEAGASYGEPGHIWADTPGSAEAAAAGTGGFLSVLGSAASGFAADVYSYPAALMRAGVEPDVSIEAQVMENTCGGTIDGWILRTNPGRAPNVEPLTMVVPGCDAVGEYLVLKDLPVTLKFARN